MNILLEPLPCALIMVALVLGGVECGHAIGAHRIRQGDALEKGFGATEGVILAMLGLLVSFTFSGAANRFEARRFMTADETSSVRASWQRIEMLDAADQPRVRDLFRAYVDARVAAYRSASDLAQARAHLVRARDLQPELWSASVAAVRNPAAPAGAPVTVLPALSQMFDVATRTNVALLNHPPLAVFILLYAVSACGALFAGIQSAQNPRRRRLHHLVLAFLLGLAVFVILELEYPRRGIVQIDAADQFLFQLHDEISRQVP